MGQQDPSSDEDDEEVTGAGRRNGISQMAGLRAHAGSD
jgi:hypothetical protein